MRKRGTDVPRGRRNNKIVLTQIYLTRFYIKYWIRRAQVLYGDPKMITLGLGSHKTSSETPDCTRTQWWSNVLPTCAAMLTKCACSKWFDHNTHKHSALSFTPAGPEEKSHLLLPRVTGTLQPFIWLSSGSATSTTRGRRGIHTLISSWALRKP